MQLVVEWYGVGFYQLPHLLDLDRTAWKGPLRRTTTYASAQ